MYVHIFPISDSLMKSELIEHLPWPQLYMLNICHFHSLFAINETQDRNGPGRLPRLHEPVLVRPCTHHRRLNEAVWLCCKIHYSGSFKNQKYFFWFSKITTAKTDIDFDWNYNIHMYTIYSRCCIQIFKSYHAYHAHLHASTRTTGTIISTGQDPPVSVRSLHADACTRGPGVAGGTDSDALNRVVTSSQNAFTQSLGLN